MPQIVLHASDLAKNTNKNQTRNLGLQSIVARENQEVAEMITDAARQGQIATSIAKDSIICSLLVTATISSLTIGGKALGKKVAVNKSENITKIVSKILSIMEHK